MAYMLADWYRPNVVLDYPKGGTGAVVDALVRGVTKRGGKLHLGAHVQEILLEPPAGPRQKKPRAVGVRLRNGRVIRARKAVISNASIWNTKRLLPPGAVPEFSAEAPKVGQCESFLHLHLGIDAAGLEGLNCHYAVVDDWSRGTCACGVGDWRALSHVPTRLSNRHHGARQRHHRLDPVAARPDPRPAQLPRDPRLYSRKRAIRSLRGA